MKIREKEKDPINECITCGFNDEDYGCTCPQSDAWYNCPIEAKKSENIKALNKYVEWCVRQSVK